MSLSLQRARRNAKLLYRWCLVDGKLDERRAQQVLSGVRTSKRRGHEMVLRQLKKLLRLYRNRHTARIDTAEPLAADIEEQVRGRVAKAYGSEIRAEFAHDERLIGGARVQLGSDVYDGSIR